MLKGIKKLLSTDFFKNTATLISGTSSAQLILIIISPILTRIYTPEDFGVLALFTAITATAGMIANAKYDLAIGLPEKDSEAVNLVALAVLSSAVSSIIFLVIIILIPQQIVEILNNPGIESYLYYIPVATFFIGTFSTMNYYSIRIKSFKNIAKANLFRQIASAVFQLSLGFLREGPIGLISGRIALHFTGNYVLTFRDSDLLKKHKYVNKEEMVSLLKRYRRFPLFTLPAQLSNVLSQQLNNIFISSLFSAATLGFYALLNRVVNMPLSLIGTSFGQVYLQRATEEKNRDGNSINIFMKTFLWLSGVGIIIFVPLYILAEPLFSFVFGEDWIIAGTYTKILIPLLFVRFITSALSLTNIVYEKQLFGLLWQAGLLLLTIGIYIVTKQLGLDIVQFLEITSYTLSVYYLILVFMTYKFSKGEARN